VFTKFKRTEKMKKIYGNERVIPYRPQLKAFFGSSNAAILYAQLEYWFAKNRGESFYKFNAPCDQPKYNLGDSLREELAFSDEEIEKASKRICRMFKSKKEFDQATDKFDGMPMCCYYDRVTYMKFYFRNHEICDYINSKDSDELPVFQDTRSVDQSVINGVIESANYGLPNPHITDSILYLYKRLQQYITQDCESFPKSIAKSDTETTSSLGEQKDQAVEDSMIQSNVRKKTLEPRGAGRGAAEISEDGQKFAKWFSTKTQMKRFKDSDLKSWGETYDKLIKIGYTKLEVAKMCEWALSDDFWKSNFLSANKLVSKNKEKVPYHEYFMAKIREVEPQKTIYNAKPYNPTGAHLQ
jgi:hypothetical protein